MQTLTGAFERGKFSTSKTPEPIKIALKVKLREDFKIFKIDGLEYQKS